MRKSLDIIGLIPKLGFSNVLLNATHRLKVKSGWYRRSLPITDWSPLPKEVVATARSTFAPPDLAEIRAIALHSEETIQAGKRILAGEMCYFSHHWLKKPLDWKSNPHSGYPTPADHWSNQSDFDPQQGDIKWIWEPSRFDWVYQLGRAWACSGSEEFVEGFWCLLDDWRKHNPPNIGINWKCGQECALRLFALVWAGGVFANTAATTPERLARLWETVAALGARIESAIGYALSQNNNHGLSETAALYIAAICLPFHPQAKIWRHKGKQLFVRQVLRQFASDGSYVQHSFNYTRLALRDTFVVLYTAQKQDDPISDEVKQRLKAAIALLYQMQYSATGNLPNYGANDGANILSLSGCPYADFRPVVQCLSYLLDQKRLYPKGAYDEELVWHFGSSALDSVSCDITRTNFAADGGGYYLIRNGSSQAMLRCHTYRSRPSQADMLHLDLWVDGINIASDGGTYQYYDKLGWGDFLKSTAAHNTVTVNGNSQMRKGSRFLWLDWTRSRLLQFNTFEQAGHQFSYWAGEHYGYSKQGVVHRRSIYASEGEWLVIDDLLLSSTIPVEITLRWHLGATEDWVLNNLAAISQRLGIGFYLYSDADDKISWLQGETYYPETGQSLYYGQMLSIAVLSLTRQAQSSFRLITAIAPQSPDQSANAVRWKGLKIALQPDEID